MPKNQIKEFIKDRFNRSLSSIGVKEVFETDSNILNETEWFNDEIIGTKHVDFFVKRSINYSKKNSKYNRSRLILRHAKHKNRF